MRITISIIITILWYLCTLSLMAQNVETVEAHAVYTAPATMTPKEARYQTILSAQVDAVARTFGTIVSAENMSFVREKDQASSSDFFALHEGDVRGVWLETIGDTIWSTPQHMADGSVIYEVRLKGKIMELKNAPIAIETKLLFNGTNPDRNEIRDFTFHDGDEMYLYFKSPVDGYLAVYIVDYDNNMTTSRILPYDGELGGIHKIMADTDYILFSKEKAEPGVRALVRGCLMRSRTNHDFNQFFVIFSPNPFSKTTDQFVGENLPSVLNFKDFQKWLSKNRQRDLQMCVEKFFVDIIKKQENNNNVYAIGQNKTLSNDISIMPQHNILSKKQKKDFTTLRKEGWQTIESDANMEAQFLRWHQMETEKQVTGLDKYFIQFSEVEDANLQVAEHRAWDDACAAIRSMENMHIQSSLKTKESSSSNNGNIGFHSDVTMSQRSKTKYAGTMNEIIKVMAIYKKNKTGYIVRMIVAKEDKK